MREDHWLTRLTTSAYPQAVVALSADSDLVPERAEPNRRVHRLARWSACGYRIDHHQKRHDWTGGGETVQSLWDAADWLARRGGLCWVISHQAARVWGLMELWSKIETKEVILDGEDKRSTCGGHGQGAVPGVRRWAARAARGGGQSDGARVREMPERVHVGRTDRHDRLNAHARCGGVAVIEDPPVIVQLKLPGRTGRILILDIRNCGIECYPVERPCAERSAWLVAVMERMVAVLRANQWGSLALTAGSQASTTLRRAYLTHGLHCHVDPVALSLERAAYVSGRCECGRLGPVTGPVYYYDVRSMYPHVCAVLALPASLRRCGQGDLPQVHSDAETSTGWIAEVEIQSEEAAYPETAARPVVYPVGRYMTTLCGPELDDALALGRVRSVGRWAEYAMSPCLREYALGVFAARMQAKADGDTPIEEWLKRLLVGVVGKLGQRGWRWEYAPDVVPLGPWRAWYEIDQGGEIRRLRTLGWTVQRELKDDWSNDAVPAVAAWVCSAARMRLLTLIRAAGWQEVYYYDTDSLHVSQRGHENLCAAGAVGSGGLGDLRLVSEETSAEYHGQKHYRLGSRRVCAGRPIRADQVGTDDDHYWYPDWLRRAAVAGRRPEVTEMLLPYRRIATYRAGVVGPGGRVYPHRRGDV